MSQRYRQLPDGTLLDTITDTVVAPLTDAPRASATAGPTVPRFPKRYPSPPAGPGATAILPSPPATMATPELGELTPTRRAIAIVGIVGVCTLTVWLQRRRKAKKSSK